MKITKKSTVEVTDITDADRLNFLQEQTDRDDISTGCGIVFVTNWAVVTKGDDIRKAIDQLIKSKVENDNA